MVDLFHDAGGKTDLVAVGGVARCCGLGELLLGDLAGKRFAQGPRRVRCAAHAHRCIDVRSAGERIADDAAGAGGRAAEGFDLRRVVVGLVLKEQQPGFFLAVDIHGHLDGAGVDLVGFVQLVHLALLLELFGCDGAQVHQADGLRAAQILAGLEIVVPGVLEQLVLERNAVDDGIECRMSAVIGPVGVDHLDLGDGGVTVLGSEVVPDHRQVRLVHRQTVVCDELVQIRVGHGGKARQGGNFRGNVVVDDQGLGDFRRGFSGFHGVDDVLLDRFHVRIAQIAIKSIDSGGAGEGTFALEDQLDALGSGVGSLVELAGQELHGEDLGVAEIGQLAGGIHLRFGEDILYGVVELFLRHVLRVVAVEHPHVLQTFDPQTGFQIRQHALRFQIESGFLFYVYSVNHVSFLVLSVKTTGFI